MIDNFLDNIILGDNIKARSDFNTLMQQKTSSALDTLKKEMSAQIFKDPSSSNEDTINLEVAVEESFIEKNDILQSIQQASFGRDSEIMLNSGEALPLDEASATIIMNYIKTLEPTELGMFVEDMINNERSFLKSLEIATNYIKVNNA